MSNLIWDFNSRQFVDKNEYFTQRQIEDQEISKKQQELELASQYTPAEAARRRSAQQIVNAPTDRIAPRSMPDNNLLKGIGGAVDKLENSKLWRTVIGNPDEGFGVGDMTNALLMANPTATAGAGFATLGKAAKATPAVAKASEAINNGVGLLKGIVAKTPTPIKAGIGAGAAVTGTETIAGAVDPDYVNPISGQQTFPSKFGSSLRAGTGDTVGLVGSVAEWQGYDELGKSLKNKGKKISEGFEPNRTEFKGWQSFLDPEWYANNVAATLPTTASLIPLMIVGYKLGGKAGTKALTSKAGQKMVAKKFGQEMVEEGTERITPFVKTIFGSLGGTALSRPLESALESGGTYEDALARGMSEEQAVAAADRVYSDNLKLAGMDVAQLALTFAPTGKVASKMGKALTATGKVVGDVATESLEEGLQQGIQQRATGADTRGLIAQMWDPTTEMKEAMAIGGLLGGGMGAVGAVRDMVTTIKQRTIAELPDDVMPTIQQRLQQITDMGVDPVKAIDQVLDEVSDSPGVKATVERITQEEAASTIEKLSSSVSGQEPGQAAPINEGTQPAAPIDSNEGAIDVVYTSDGTPLRIIDQSSPAVYVVQDQEGNRDIVSRDDVSEPAQIPQKDFAAPKAEKPENNTAQNQAEGGGTKPSKPVNPPKDKSGLGGQPGTNAANVTGNGALELDNVQFNVENGIEDDINSPKPAKEPWQMTRDEYSRAQLEQDAEESQMIDYIEKRTNEGASIADIAKGLKVSSSKVTDLYNSLVNDEVADIDEQAGPEEQHKSEVERAIKEGKPVPEEVLRDYPDLTGPKPETNKSEQEPTGTESTGDKGQTNTADNIDVTKLPDHVLEDIISKADRVKDKPGNKELLDRVKAEYEKRGLGKTKKEPEKDPDTPPKQPVDMDALKAYAEGVVKSGEVEAVYLIGSTATKGSGNDIDILYQLKDRKLPESEEDATEKLESIVESLDMELDLYDTFIQVGERYFHLSSGAGRGFVENNDYANENKDKPKVLLARAEKAESHNRHIEETPEEPEKEPTVKEVGEFTITKTKHTKTGADMWVVRLKDDKQLPTDEFKKLAARIKALGGSRWSKFSKGFNFYEDPTEKLQPKAEVKKGDKVYDKDGNELTVVNPGNENTMRVRDKDGNQQVIKKAEVKGERPVEPKPNVIPIEDGFKTKFNRSGKFTVGQYEDGRWGVFDADGNGLSVFKTKEEAEAKLAEITGEKKPTITRDTLIDELINDVVNDNAVKNAIANSDKGNTLLEIEARVKKHVQQIFDKYFDQVKNTNIVDVLKSFTSLANKSPGQTKLIQHIYDKASGSATQEASKPEPIKKGPTQPQYDSSAKVGDHCTWTIFEGSHKGRPLSGVVTDIAQSGVTVKIDDIPYAPGAGREAFFTHEQFRNKISRIEGDRAETIKIYWEGYRKNNPYEYEDITAQKIKATGDTVTVKTERGTEVEVQYALVEANKLVTSHTTSFTVNSKYPSELQPRDRSRAAFEMQVIKIAKDIEPSFLGESPKASDGAPIVGPDLVVESGNGRTLALLLAYGGDYGTPDKYLAWLRDNVKKLGIDPQILDEMKAPALVRIRRTEVDRAKFAKEANEQATAAMSATEQAMADAKSLSLSLLELFYPSEDGSILNRANDQFIRGFMQEVIGPTEMGRYITADKSISQEGVNRIRNAIFAKAYGDVTAIEKLAESTDNNTKNITNAMLAVAPKFAKMKSGIENGSLHDLDITLELANAARKLSHLKEQGQAVATYLNQLTMFDNELSPLAKDLLTMLDTYNRSSKRLASILSAYVDGVLGLGEPNQGGLWGGDKLPSRADVLLAAIKEKGGDLSGNVQTNLFDYKPEESKPNATSDQAGGTAAEQEQGEPVAEQSGPAAKSESPTLKIAKWVQEKIDKKERFSNQELFDVAKEFYGGGQAEAKFTPKDAYDAMELGVNLWLLSRGRAFNLDVSKNAMGKVAKATIAVKYLQDKLLGIFPTMRNRTTEMDEFQQFSTPPSIAYIAAWVANVNGNDTVLEPSAGIGGLAVFGKITGAKVIVNELSQRRAEVLRHMKFDRVFTENAEQINNILPKDVKPTVVIMNPPFSSTAGRIKGKNQTKNATIHIEQALKRLEPGGRLVAILGRGMANNTPTFREWWNKIRTQYTVQANIGINGDNYTKYGTGFDVQIVVIDKIGPNQKDTVIGRVDNLEDILPILEAIRNDRPQASGTAQQNADQSVRQPTAQEGEAAPGTGHTTPIPTDNLGAGEQPGANSGRSGTGSGSKPDRSGRTGASNTSAPEANGPVDQDGTSTGSELGGNIGAANNENSQGSSSVPSGTTEGSTKKPNAAGDRTGTIEIGTKEAEKTTETELGDAVYSQYKPQKLKVKGAKPHPADLVQSSAMASVEPPDPTYSPNLPQEVIDQGKLSIAQIESVVYAGQAHQEILPDGQRRGFFIGDGTGVGKGREIAAIILDNMRQGRTKAVWVTENKGLLKSARRDYGDIGGDAGSIFEQGKINTKNAIKQSEGIIFTSYNTLGQGQTVDRSGNLTQRKADTTSRLEQLVNWLGEDFDGVIAFDEAHNMQNSLSMKGARGINKPAGKALAGVELQKRLPNARIVYVSATGATEVSNLAYCDRLGLWGKGTPFADKRDFVAEIASSGLAAMELVARDMKSMGAYIARNIGFDGVSYSTLEHTLTKDQREIYDTMAEGWQIVLQNIMEALKETNAVDPDTGANTMGNGAKAKAMGAFWGAQQRFFNQILTSMQMPTAIRSIKEDIAEGKAVVLQLVNTNEAQLNRAMADIEEGDSLEDLDMTPRAQLMMFVEKSFPIYQYEEYTDEDGNVRSRPVYDSEGNMVENPEAVAMRDALLERIGSMKVPDGPMEILFNEFGTEMVAEITGRSRRVVRKLDGQTGRMERIAENRTDNDRMADENAFMDDRKQILVFSDAGGTGRSYHADNTRKNQRQRKHYLIQAGWTASKAVQGFGRTHRSNQASAPEYVLVTTDLKGQKRFMASIARRLDQLGALTKGQRQAGGQGLFSEKDNLEGPMASDALVIFYNDLLAGDIPGISGQGLMPKLGLDSLLDEYGNLKEDPRTRKVPLFLNRLLTLDSSLQNRVFDEFYGRMETLVERAIATGTLDTGMENFKADKSVVVNEETVFTDKHSGAETKLVEFEAYHKIKPLTYAQVAQIAKLNGFLGYYRNARSGRVVMAQVRGTVTTSNGRVVNGYYLYDQDKGNRSTTDEIAFNKGNWENIKADDVKELWDKAVDDLPEYRKQKVHLITGALLPIWDRLPDGKFRVVRVLTEDSRILLGRVIPERSLEITLSRLGAGRSGETEFDMDDVVNRIMAGAEARLSNGWRIVRRSVSGESRIEIMAEDTWKYAQEIIGAGGYSERVNYKTRYFVPTNRAAAISCLEALTEYRPIVEVINSGGVSLKAGSNKGKTTEGAEAPIFYDPNEMLDELSGKLGRKMYAAPEAMEREDMQAAGIIANLLTQSQLIPMKGQDAPQGAAYGNNVFVSVETEDPHLYVAMHEIEHTLEDVDPEAHDEFMAIAKKYFNGAVGMSDYYFRHGYSYKDIWKEFTADVTAEIMQQPGFWAKVREQSPALIKKIVDIIDQIITKFRKEVAKDSSMLQYISDIEAFRDEVAGATAKLLKKKPRNLLDLRGAEAFAAKIKQGSSSKKGVPFLGIGTLADFVTVNKKAKSNLLAGIGTAEAGKKPAIKLETRYKPFGVGKSIGGRVYMHRQYENLLQDKGLEAAKAKLPDDFNYVGVTWDTKTGDITFTESPDFYTSDEPIVGDQFTVKADGTTRTRKANMSNPQIWHHKWLWVKDDFTGFDVEASKERSRQWLSISNVDKSRIGYKAFWDQNVVPLIKSAPRLKVAAVQVMSQAISSANTSLSQVASTFKSKWFKPGKLNIDIGGGRYDKGSDYLQEAYGTENLIFDPFNRDEMYNRRIIKRLQSGERGDTVTVNNVLNVIAEKDVRLNVVKQAAKAVSPGGEVYFQIYEGNGSGQGKETSKGFQMNLKAQGYIEEVQTHFERVERHGSLIVATGPKNIEGPAIWELGNNKRISFKHSKGSGFNLPNQHQEVQDRMEGARGVPAETLRERMQEIWDEVVRKTTREFEHLPHGGTYAELRNSLLLLRKQKGIAADKTLKVLNDITKPLDEYEYDVFSYKVIFDDLAHEFEENHLLPFGLTEENFEDIKDYIDEEAAKLPKVQEAIEKRRGAWNKAKNDYIQAQKAVGFNVEDRLKKEDYFRHQVLEYANGKGVMGSGKRLRVQTGRGFLRKRGGSTYDINTDYLQAEFEVMAQMIVDTASAGTVKVVKENHDIVKELKREAVHINDQGMLQEFQRLLDIMGDTETTPEQLYRRTLNRKQAIAYSQLYKLAAMGELPNGNGKWDQIIEEMSNAYWDAKEANANDESGEGGIYSARIPNEYQGQLMAYLNYLASQDESEVGKIKARTVFKGMAQKVKTIQKTLGTRYVTWEDLIPDGYTAWQPREGHMFFMADSIPQNMAEQLLFGIANEINIDATMLKKVMVAGQKYPELVIPDEVALTLETLYKDANQVGPVAKWLFHTPYRAWKQWQLISPRRFFKYNVRNTTGDLDAVLAGNPSALRPKILKKAWDDLKQGFFSKDREYTRSLQGWFERGGFETLMQAQEINDINRNRQFRHLMESRMQKDLWEKAQSSPKTLWNGYWDTVRATTDFREALMRYACYLDYLEQMQANHGIPKNFGASNREEVMALPDIRDRAAKLSNELLGAYDEVSVVGTWLADHLFPFWRWNEVNFTRYMRLGRNAWQDGQLCATTARKFTGLAIRSPLIAAKIGKFVLQATALTVMLNLWNMLFFGDEDKELPEDVRNRLHITFGRDSNGNILYFSRLGALQDFLDWFGMDTPVKTVQDFLSGRKSLLEIATDWGKADVNKVLNAITPFVKTPVELITDTKFYPDVFEAMPIRDRWQYLFDSFGLGNEYKAMAGKPTRGYGNSLYDLFYYRADPYETAYYKNKENVIKFRKKIGTYNEGYNESVRSDALYNIKLAMRYGDKEAAEKYLLDYINKGGTAKGLSTSLKSLSPVYRLNETQTEVYIQNYLDVEGKENLAKAIDYYQRVIGGEMFEQD